MIIFKHIDFLSFSVCPRRFTLATVNIKWIIWQLWRAQCHLNGEPFTDDLDWSTPSGSSNPFISSFFPPPFSLRFHLRLDIVVSDSQCVYEYVLVIGNVSVIIFLAMTLSVPLNKPPYPPLHLLAFSILFLVIPSFFSLYFLSFSLHVQREARKEGLWRMGGRGLSPFDIY